MCIAGINTLTPNPHKVRQCMNMALCLTPHARYFWVSACSCAFLLCTMHNCPHCMFRSVFKCMRHDRIWVGTPFFCMMHDIVTGFRIPNKCQLLSKSEFCFFLFFLFKNGAFSTHSLVFISQKKQMSHISRLQNCAFIGITDSDST